jgi:hypothetical protein
MRTVPAELAKRYAEAGWWTRDTIGVQKFVLRKSIAEGT